MDVKTAGSLGGKATLKKKGKDYFKEISLKGVKARQEKAQKTETSPIQP